MAAVASSDKANSSTGNQSRRTKHSNCASCLCEHSPWADVPLGQGILDRGDQSSSRASNHRAVDGRLDGIFGVVLLICWCHVDCSCSAVQQVDNWSNWAFVVDFEVAGVEARVAELASRSELNSFGQYYFQEALPFVKNFFPTLPKHYSAASSPHPLRTGIIVKSCVFFVTSQERLQYEPSRLLCQSSIPSKLAAEKSSDVSRCQQLILQTRIEGWR